MTDDNSPRITTPAPFATWEYKDPKRQFGDNRIHYVQATAAGSITIHVRNGEMVIPADMVPWFVDSVVQAHRWMKDPASYPPKEPGAASRKPDGSR